MHRQAITTSLFLGLVLLAGGFVTAQSQRAPATLDDLLTEVRGLREDLVGTSSTGVRVQLLSTRLSLQEQRIADLGRQYTARQVQLEDILRERREQEGRLKTFESEVSGNTLPLGQLREIEQMIPRLRDEVTTIAATEQRVREALQSMSNQIAAAQSGWTDFSNRLDELERSLPK